MFRSPKFQVGLFLLTSAALTAGVVGQVGATSSSERAALPAVAASTTTTTPAPVTTTTEAPVTTTTLAPATTTTEAPTTTTTALAPVTPPVPTAPAPPTTTTTAAPARTATEIEADRMAQVVAIVDSSGFDWRAAGIGIRIGFHPDDCCHWGNYDSHAKQLWIGPTAFANDTRLRYVVLHEIAHGFQITSGRWQSLQADMMPWGYSGASGLEASADCIAAVWGATMGHYWKCAPAAKLLMARRLAGDWS